MGKNVPIGPGVEGIAAGLAWGRMRNLQDDTDWLSKELAATKARLLHELARSKGLEVTLNTVVREIAAEDAGTLITRRVSDPLNRHARIQVLENATEDELFRLSGGRLRLDRETKRKP